jgi:hypothetical protein
MPPGGPVSSSHLTRGSQLVAEQNLRMDKAEMLNDEECDVLLND